jgi:dynein heavy chain 2
MFQSNLSKLYNALNLDDGGTWSNFARSSQCEQEVPSGIEKRISLFQQVLLVQAIRPDRLQSAMGLFACRALGKFIVTLSCFLIGGDKYFMLIFRGW